jgi:hypothetical protein
MLPLGLETGFFFPKVHLFSIQTMSNIRIDMHKSAGTKKLKVTFTIKVPYQNKD